MAFQTAPGICATKTFTLRHSTVGKAVVYTCKLTTVLITTLTIKSTDTLQQFLSILGILEQSKVSQDS